MIRIAIADDHALVREGLRRTLDDEPEMQVVGEAADSDTLLALLDAHAVDVAIVDIAMPGVGFLELLRRLRDQHPDVRTVVVSAHADREYAVRSFQAGAKAYLEKARSGAELVEAVRRAARGSRYLTEAQGEWLVDQLGRDEATSPTSQLSAREFEVLGLLAHGRSAKEIAATIGVSIKTVSTYRTRLLEKLHLRTTAELIRFAIQHRIGL